MYQLFYDGEEAHKLPNLPKAESSKRNRLFGSRAKMRGFHKNFAVYGQG